MSIPPESELEPEIAHVLLMDVVGYSKLLVDDQITLLGKLNRLVRATAQFKAAESKSKLIRLPTGDGMALLFFSSPDAPVRCALEVSAQVRNDPQMQLRMGIHSGPVKPVLDVNDRANAAGAGIDIAQRVLDCGDAGHILLSERAAEDLRPSRRWNKSAFCDLGECEVKHGLRLHIFNLCDETGGNTAIPFRIREQRRPLRRWRAEVRRRTAGSPWRKAILLAVGFIPLGLLVGIGLWAAGLGFNGSGRLAPSQALFEKSIARIPFENLSDDPQNAFFAEGVQDEILTNLARVADLKVISRTSVMQYRAGGGRNLKEIARELGVAHILEGTVRSFGTHIRISAQLIDARTDGHLWADQYDKDLTDIFAIQSEIAEAVARQLEAKLSPQEKAAIEEPPTANLAAFELYVRGKSLLAATTFNARKEDLVNGTSLLAQATAVDPAFSLAYYQLARAHCHIYRLGIDHTAARLELAAAAVKAVARLRPDSGEAHLAAGELHYYGYRNYDQARQEFIRARCALPTTHDPICCSHTSTAARDARRNRWKVSSVPSSSIRAA